MHPAGLIVIFCLSVLLSQSGEAWERVNGGSGHVWLFRVSRFVCLLAAKGRQAMLVLSTVGAQLSLNEHEVSQKYGKASVTTNPEPRSETLYTGVNVTVALLCVA